MDLQQVKAGTAAMAQHHYPDLCENMWLEIFKKLPIKSLCRFRCVCKSWNSLFNSRIFMALHHNYLSSLANQESSVLSELHARYHPDPDESHLRRHFNYLHPVKDEAGSYRRRFSVIGVIHGVVCLASSQHELHTILWNPATRKYIHYICARNPIRDRRGLDLGFGFDAVNNDFKVVMTALPWYSVLSVDNGSWRESVTKSVEGYTTRPECGACFTNRTIHWIAMTNANIDWLKLPYDDLQKITYTFALLLFDCESEQFKTMELPQQLVPNGRNQYMCDLVQLFTYRDMLAALQQKSRGSNCHALWVMEEHGVASTWKKLYNIDEQAYVAKQYLVLGEDGVISQPSEEELSYRGRGNFVDIGDRYSVQPLNGQAFVESLFLMDVKADDRGRDAKADDRGGDAKADDRGRDAKGYVVRFVCSAYDFLFHLLQTATSNWY